MKWTLPIRALLLAAAWTCLPADATNYYCDPAGGSMGNAGTSTNSPWASLESVFLAIKTFNAGDEIFLMNGQHGQPRIALATQTDYVTVKPFPGHTPKIASLRVHAGSYWAFDGLTFTTDGSGGTFNKDYMLETLAAVHHVKIENCDFYSTTNSSLWSKADWDANADKAVLVRGDHTVVNSNTIINTSFALEIQGDYTEAKGNLIDNFSGDALRALGSHAVYEGNVIRDAYVHDYAANHDDAIQMYPITGGVFDPNGVIDDVVFRNNKIYTFADPITQAMINDNLVGYWMQAIIVTDGHAENMVLENNLVVGDHTHGITLSGPLNCRVQNNTVIKTPTPANPDSGSSTPRINFINSKVGGFTPTGSTIRNNIASDISYVGSGLTIENNLIPAAGTYTSVFADYNNFDLGLKTNSVAIDAGVNTDLTATDIIGNPRLVGPTVDQGAYELQTPPVISEATDTYFNDEVMVTFNETVTQATAEDIGNYTINGGVSVTMASLNPNGTTVTLTTTALTNGFTYTVTADGVENLGGVPSLGTSDDFNYLCNTNWASSFQDDQYGTYPPEDAFDNDLNTRWSAEGLGEWIQYGFCQDRIIESVDIAFHWGDLRTYDFAIEVSTNGRAFTQVFAGSSSGGTTGLETFDFTDLQGKYIRITGSGNSVNLWNNYAEIVIHTSDVPTGYDAWILDYPGVGTETNMTDNPDGDSLNNLYEWGLGGNPDDDADVGHVPTFGIAERDGNDWLEYIYAKRNDADALGLVYYMEQNTNLVDGVWTNANYDFQEGEPDSAGPGFGTVTNWVITTVEDAQFMRLIIKAN